MIVVVCFGYIGNCLVFRVFFSNSFKKYTISIYFCATSIVDSLMLLNALTSFASQKYNYILSNANGFFCKAKQLFSYSMGPCAPWLMVCMIPYSIIHYYRIYPNLFPLPINILLNLTKFI
jgi:hypothetical protein